jgi:DNA (cytosine-5)-methyltransferase 3A
MRFLRTELDLLIGGSPCQDLSAAKADGKGLAGEKSGLFFEYVRILEEIKAENPDIQFLLENVASMKKADRDEITRIMGVEPILINSALVSAQNRKRLYWTNIPGITQPEDKEIFLRDIIDEIPIEDPSWKQLDEKYIQTLKENKNCLYETNSSGKMRQGYEMFKEDGKTYGITVGHARNTRIL